jgi:hypothetical protein
MKRSRASLLVAGIGVSIALLASACGGPATPGVASLSGNSHNASHDSTSQSSGTSGTSSRHTRIAYARCMRSHGVKDFPEGNGPIKISPGSSLDPNSPTFQAAQKACASLLPKPSAAQVQKIKENALKYSKCMRSHGVTNFPDPTVSTAGGGISIRIGVQHGGGGGLNPNSPTFQAAQRACQHILNLPKGGKGFTGGKGFKA